VHKYEEEEEESNDLHVFFLSPFLNSAQRKNFSARGCVSRGLVSNGKIHEFFFPGDDDGKSCKNQ
jgi:hypothetical protein